MIFDFAEYLARIDPDVQYEVKELLGGVVNFTVRATKIDNAKDKGVFPGYDSVILKHAPPYLAALGEAAPFSQYRQTVEARGISLATTIIKKHHNILLPTLLRHDEEEHVLVLRDLGMLPNLSDMFFAVGGFNPMFIESRDTTFAELHTSTVDSDVAKYFRNIGNELGHFFALLHSPHSRDLIIHNPDLGPEYLTNPTAKGTVFDHQVKPIRDQLMLFPGLVTLEDVDIFYSRIAADYREEIRKERKGFVLGDCWPAAVLIEPTFSSEQTPKIGVVDWEFASIGATLEGDIAQFLAHLELLHIAAIHQHLDVYATYIDNLVEGFVAQYTATSIEEQAAWTISSTIDTTSIHPTNHEPSSPTSSAGDIKFQILRSALIRHACEMISCSFWKMWPCSAVDCPCPRTESDTNGNEDVDPKGPKLHIRDRVHECTLIRKLVQRAIWYIRVAGDDVEEFKSERNWKRILEVGNGFRSDDLIAGKESGENNGLGMGMGILKFFRPI